MKFSYDDVEASCLEMREVFNSIKTLSSEISDSFNLIESTGCWQGNGSQVYSNKIKKITQQFEVVNECLENNVKYLEETIEGYSSLDKRIVLGLAGLFDKTGSDN